MIRVSIENVNQNTIQLFDQTGKEVTNLVSITFGNENEFLVDISQLSSGLYILKTYNGIGKIVKE